MAADYTAFVHRIIQANFGIEKGELTVDGVPVTSIVERHGTPLFVYSRRVLDARVEALKETCPEGFRIHYSIKANPNPTIIRRMLSHGLGLEIASLGEYEKAVEAGCDPADIIFAGPGKTYRELESVITRGIGELHIESLREAERISEIAAAQQKTVAVALRVNPSEASAGAMRMGGKPAQFGIDEEQLDAALDFISAHPRLNFAGIHLFIGTQILDAEALLANYRNGVRIARGAAGKLGKPIRTLDFGGGLGIPYFAGDSPLDLIKLRDGLRQLIQEIASFPEFRDTRFIIEPGRFLVGECGVYIARVNDVKVSKGKKFVILDGGMNHHLAASGNLGQTIKRNFPIAVVNKFAEDTSEAVDVVGPLCTPLDTLGRQVPLPPVNEGDLIGIFQSGAYGRSASPLEFLSHAAPQEILIDENPNGLAVDWPT